MPMCKQGYAGSHAAGSWPTPLPWRPSFDLQTSNLFITPSGGETFIEKRPPTYPFFDSAGAIPCQMTAIRKSGAEQSIASPPLNQNNHEAAFFVTKRGRSLRL